MGYSNIVAGSNVYICKKENPFFDSDFVGQINDRKLLKNILQRRGIDSRIAKLSTKQMAIVEKGKRCTYAKNDPCFGYVEGKGIQCKCINIECPGIYDRRSFLGKTPWKGCNPGITDDYINLWTLNPKDKEAYPDPEEQPLYYLVDMISDEEMSRYYYEFLDDGVLFPTPIEHVVEEREDDYIPTSHTRIDPKTGRKMVIIGYSRMKYPFEECGLGEPIWGIVDEAESEKSYALIRKAKRIEKKEKSKVNKARLNITDKHDDTKEISLAQLEKNVIEKISDEVKLTEVDKECFVNRKTIIVLDNPAELAVVSNALLIEGIDHDYIEGSDIVLTLMDDFEGYTLKDQVMISNTIVSNGCTKNNVKTWKTLSGLSSLIKLSIAYHEYYLHEYGGKNRWIIKGMYGATHICVFPEDLGDLSRMDDGLYPILLADEGSTYMVCGTDGTMYGHTAESFLELINSLMEADYITASPDVVKGITLKVKEGYVKVLGVGHMRFGGY